MTVADIEKELGGIEAAKLSEYAILAAKFATRQLRDISGGNSNAPEKWYYLAEGFGMKPEGIIKGVILQDEKPAAAALALAKVYFDKGPITLDANPKAITNETATFNYNTFFTAQLVLASALKAGKVAAADRDEALKQLLKFTARTEWLLRNKPFTYQQWAQAFLVPNLAPADPVSLSLLEVFGNPIVSTYYLGEGTKRPKKN